MLYLAHINVLFLLFQLYKIRTKPHSGISSEVSFCHLIHSPATAQLFSTMYFLRALLMYGVFNCNFVLLSFISFIAEDKDILLACSFHLVFYLLTFSNTNPLQTFFWSLSKDFAADDCLTVHLVCPIPQLPVALSILNSISTPFAEFWCTEVNVKIPANLLMI